MKRLILSLILLLPAPAWAQQTQILGADSTTGARTPVTVTDGALDVNATVNASVDFVDGDMDPLTDDPNDSLNVTCVSGCSGGTTDTDDGDVSGAQTTGIQINLLQLWSGSAWVRALGGSGAEASGVLRVTEATDSALNTAVAAIQSAAEATQAEVEALNDKVNQDVAHDNAASSTGPQVMDEAKDFDGSALPNSVSAEGDAVRPGASLAGVRYVMPVTENGAFSPIDQTTGRMRASSVCQDDSLVTSVPISTATSGNVELVAISGSTVVYVCGFDVISAGTVNVQFIMGTGTACATGETDKTGTYQLTAQAGLARSNGGAVQFKGTAGQALCIELSGAVQIDGLVTYVQQ